MGENRNNAISAPLGPLLIGLKYEYLGQSSHGTLGRHIAVIESLRMIHIRQVDFFRFKWRFATLKELADFGLNDDKVLALLPLFREHHLRSSLQICLCG